MSTFFNFRNQGLQDSIAIRLICLNYRIKVVFLSSYFFMLIGYRLSTRMAIGYQLQEVCD